ncbi:MAG: hypothetical protein U5K75_02280 [Ahrensia sp.]|nr:hypothetical protein [Ahrensia sp.]
MSGVLSSASDYVGGWKNLAMILGGFAFAPALVATAVGLMQIGSGIAFIATALAANPVGGLAFALITGGACCSCTQSWASIDPYFSSLFTSYLAGAAYRLGLDQKPIQLGAGLWRVVAANAGCDGNL